MSRALPDAAAGATAEVLTDLAAAAVGDVVRHVAGSGPCGVRQVIFTRFAPTPGGGGSVAAVVVALGEASVADLERALRGIGGVVAVDGGG